MDGRVTVKRKDVEEEMKNMHGMLFAPHNLELYKAYYGSEEVARAELQGLWDEFCKQPKFIGLKPKPRTCSPDVQVHALFDAYAVHIWGAGLDFLQAYHFDFVDPHSGDPVNLPAGWKMHVAPGTLTPWNSLLVPPMMEMMSMEAAHGLQPHEIHPGEEKYIAQEGTRFCVVSPEGLVRSFQLPIRQDIHITAGQALVFDLYRIAHLRCIWEPLGLIAVVGCWLSLNASEDESEMSDGDY
ncbi:hypothetical protein HYDPIDRAFT_168354 [Hydnomerulius pinastri MD-312]|uniref:Uncharacterized protein n=1 Tax=Hydnomerulius pinastri MD-312 TaxID=994086 RepID=A0A0C9W806_9AGAM|nr:hypothetical protein HYDPIDRAFT_168354 [Hydnomerulius pinastri MD-312]